MAKRRETEAERTIRLLDEYMEEQAARRAALGPRRPMAPLYFLEVTPAVARRARAIWDSGGEHVLAHTYLALRPHAVSYARANLLGDYDALTEVLREVDDNTEIAFHVWTPSRARRVLAVIEKMRLPGGVGTRGKLVRVLGNAIAHENAFAIVMDDSMV